MKVELGEVNWELLREQKQNLITASRKFNGQKNHRTSNLIDGVVLLIDQIQDSAVDDNGVDSILVFGKPKTIDDVTWDMVGQYYPKYHSASEIAESDILQRYEDDELMEDENARDIEWVKSLGDWKKYKNDLDTSILQRTLEEIQNL